MMNERQCYPFLENEGIKGEGSLESKVKFYLTTHARNGRKRNNGKTKQSEKAKEKKLSDHGLTTPS